MNPSRRLALALARTALPAAVLAALAATASADQWTVHVGRGGTNFVDDRSGTNVTQAHVGDTVTWVWEGSMEHSVTSGTCRDGGGGGGGGGYGGYGGGGGGCDDAHLWDDGGVHGSGFSFSWTFTTAGTFSYFCQMHLSAMTGKVIVAPAVATGCASDPHTLCLNGGRFSATAHWTKPDGSEGDGNATSLTDDSGYFWFFDATNIEVVSKVLNGCALDNAYWVFAAGLTNVQVRVTVTDTQTGAVYVRDNAQGAAFQPIQDTHAFPTSCP